MVILYLLLFCAYVALHWYIANEFYNAATAKGFPQKKYFWWCFWLSYVGWLMVIALPDHGSTKPSSVMPSSVMPSRKAPAIDIDELPDL